MWGSHGPVKRPDRAERAVTKRPLLLPAATSITRHTRATRRWARKKKNCSCVISTVTNTHTHTHTHTHTQTNTFIQYTLKQTDTHIQSVYKIITDLYIFTQQL